MGSARLRRALTAVALTVASVGIAGGGTAHATDTYRCNTQINYFDLTIVGCIHLGGNGYWQPYIIVENGGGQMVSGNMWINSNGVYSANPSQGLSGYQNNDVEGQVTIWGASTNWRVSCYVQAQATVYIDGTSSGNYIGKVFSPSMEVC